MKNRRASLTLAMFMGMIGVGIGALALGLLMQILHTVDRSSSAVLLLFGFAIMAAAMAAFCFWVAIRIEQKSRRN